MKAINQPGNRPGNQAVNQPVNQPIAITGMACRFPGAPSLAEFWRLLCEGRHGIGPVPAERWDADAMFDQDAKARGKINTRHGGFIDAVDRFDAAFFGISPREATQMDPQQRILLELAYLALEDAGICPERLAGTDASVFVGAMTNEYIRHQLAEGYNRVDVHTGSGAGLCMLANRLSYQFDLRGPSVAVDTACSSSLVAVFQACQSLWTGQSRLAIAAGVNVMLDPAFNVFYGKAGLSAPDGKCKTFSAAANGIGRAEGAGVVVLKRLQDALADSDPIYAVIRGGAVNHDGRSNGMTQPNRWAQEQLLRSAFENARVDAKELEYIELHGTGTLIGDPIEANAIGSVLTESGARANPCLVGSVKTNLGHLEAAAGIAGLIKLALSVHHGEIPQSLWFDAPNPHIAFDRIPIRVNTERTPWPGRDGKRLSGISSFGLGGTNTHLVVEAAPSQKGINSRHENAHYHLFLSARSETALKELAGGYVEFLATTSDADLAMVCSTAMTRKGVHDYRLSVLGESGAALIAKLRAFIAGEPHVDVVHGRYRPAHRRLAIALSEHESIDARMAANWLAQMPVARAAWNECQHLFCEQGVALLPSVEELAARSDMRAGDEDFRAWHFALQYALLKQLRTSVRLAESIKCINADGLGQLAALCMADAISIDTAIRWIKADLSPDCISGPDSSARGYSIACECSAGKNPAPVEIDWRPSRRSLKERLAADHAHAETDVVLIKLNRLPELDADRSEDSGWIASEDDYGFQRVFARLALCYQLEWSALADDNGFVRLPAYRWQRDSFWLSRNVAAELSTSATHLGGDLGGNLQPANAAESVSATVIAGAMRYALLGARLEAPTPCWDNRLSTATLQYLPDHRVQSLMVLPGSGYIELGLAVHREVTAAERGVLENVEFHKALVIEDDHEPLMRVAYDETTRTYSVYTQQRRTKQWDLHARGRLSLLPPSMPAAVNLDSLKSRCTEVIDGVTHYADMSERGFGYGPYFQGVRQLWFNRDGDEVLAWVQSDQALGEIGQLARLHPAIFDACLQTLLTPLGAKGDDELYIPVGIRQVKLFSTPQSGFWVHGILHQVARGSVEGEVTLFADDGQVIAEARGVRASVLTQKQSDELKHLDRWLYQFSWQNQPAEFTEGTDRGRWLVFADSYGTSQAFIEQLRLAGANEIVEVLPGTAYERCSATQFHINAHSKEDLRRVLQSNPGIAGIVYLWGTDTSNEECPLAGSMSRVVPVVNLLQILAAEYGDRPPSLSVVTRRAQSVDVHEQTEAVVQSPLIGLVRVSVNEYPKQRLRAVDIDADAITLQSLAREVLSESVEDEVALRGAERFVHRMVRSSSFATSALDRQGAELAPQEVDVALKVAAVSRMTAPSSSPSPNLPQNSLGECAFEGLGTVSRTGREVSQVGSGDEVYVCLSGSLDANIVAPASCVIPIAAHNAAAVSERAGQIAAFVTAYYALHRVARLQRGETLFIHEAATSTGLAAIQVAQWLGARVYATATDDRQREHLQSLSLAGVIDGSLPDCVDRVVDHLEVRGLDAGGLDVVFNTISGEIASHAFAALLPGGRFVDIASTENAHAIANVVAPGSAQANRSVSSVDIRQLMAEQPRVFAEILDQVCERFRAGDFAGIPEQVFSVAESAAAVTAANANDRIGTVTIRFDAAAHRPAGLQPGSFRQDGSYLITGGCGGFGLEIAAWMVEQGARDIALVGRRGAHTISAQQAVEKLRKRGARVLVIAADIGEESAVERVIATIEREMTPLRGVFHAAAALDDAPIAQLEPKQIENAFAAKARGAWHLHRHTSSKQLDHFVLFSSIAAMVGGAGQASYAMSCIYLDALARHRRGLGLSAVSVNWGALSEVGMAARYGDAQRHLNRSGVGSFTPRQAVKLFGRVLHWNPVEIGVANMDWKSWGETYPAFTRSPKYSALHVAKETTAQSKNTAVVQALLAMPADARLPIVMQHLTGLLAATLTTTPEEIDCGLSLLSLGVDSLMAMEFQAAIDKDFGIKIPTLELMKGNSLTQLGEQLAKAIDVAVDPAASTDRQRGPVSLDELDIEGAEHFIANLDALAEDEIDRLLATVMPHEELRV